MVFAKQMLGNQSDAEDLVQTSVIKALTHPSAPAAGADLQKWLYRVVRNGAIDKIREQARFVSYESEDDIGSTSDFESPELQLEQEQLQERLKKALMKLPITQKEIIVLRDYHQSSYDDIAEILSIPKGTVMSRLHRARLALRTLLLKQQSIETTKVTQEV
nr:RNA polymerase sigma factor [Kangiella sp. HZ709]